MATNQDELLDKVSTYQQAAMQHLVALIKDTPIEESALLMRLHDVSGELLSAAIVLQQAREVR